MGDLKIKIVMDRSQAKAAAEGHISDEKRMVDASAKGAAALKQSFQSVAQTRAALDAKARDEQVRFIAGLKQTGDAGSAAFGSIGASVGVMTLGLGKAMGIARDFGKIMQDAAENYRKLTGNFTSDRDKLGELANIMGRQNDNAFTLQNSEFNKATGLRFDEGLSFRSAFHNAGEQFKGTRISDAEHAQFEEQAAALALARKVDPAVVGNLAGTLLGGKDRTKLGDRASEDALGKLNSGMAILAAGKGDNAVLGRQFDMLASSSLTEDSMRGAFQDSDEVATVISVAAEKHDASAAESVKAAMRGLRDFDGKAKDLLKKANINSQTRFIDAIKQLSPVVEAEARARGVNVQDVLAKSFDDLTAEGIAIQMNRGVAGGLYANRAGVAAANQGERPALDLIGQFRASEPGQQRISDADLKLSQDRIGAADSRAAILRQQALKSLTDKGMVGTTYSGINDWVEWGLGLGMNDPKEDRIQREQASILARRAREQIGVNVDPLAMTRFQSPEQVNRNFNALSDRISAGGGDPTRNLTREQAETNKLLREQNALLAKLVANTAPNQTPMTTPPPRRIDRAGGRPTR